MARRSAVSLLIIVALLVDGVSGGCSHSRHSTTAKFSHGVASDDELGVRIIAGSHEGQKVMFTAVKNSPPSSSTLPFAARIRPPVDVVPPAGLIAAEVRLRFNPAKDLPAVRPGSRRPSVANAFIAAYSEVEQAWLPLPTTYDASRHELVATTPHFTSFQPMTVMPGNWHVPNLLSNVKGGLTRFGNGLSSVGDGLATVGSSLRDSFDVVLDDTVGGVEALARTIGAGISDFVEHLTEELTGAYPDDKHVDCGGGLDPAGKIITDSTEPGAPSNKSASANRWTVDLSGSLAGDLQACIVDDPAGTKPTRWLRIENHQGAPLSLFPPRGGEVDTIWNGYDVAMIDDPLFLLQRMAAATVMSSVMPGARGTELRVTTNKSFTVAVSLDWFAVVLDVVLTMLTMLTPVVESMAKEALTWDHARIKDLSASGEKITPEDLMTPEKVTHFQELLDLYNCVKGTKEAADVVSLSNPLHTDTRKLVTGLLDAARGCVSTVFHKSTLASVLGGALTNLKTAPELRDLIANGRKQGLITVHAPVTSNQLTDVDWKSVAGPLLKCDSTLPPEVVAIEEGDINGDSVPDTFVDMDCSTGDNWFPNTLLAYDGASDPARPHMLGAVFTDVDGNYFNRGGCLTFTGSTVTVRANRYRDADSVGGPSLVITQPFTWNGTTFTRGRGRVSNDPSPFDQMVPGCT